MMKRSSTVVLPFSLLALSCAAAPHGKPSPTATKREAPAVAIVAPPPAAPLPPETPAPPPVSVAWLEQVPASPVIDGDPAEWGSLLPPPEPPKEPKAGSPGEEEAPPPPRPDPRDAPSHVAVAITERAAFVVADLAAEARAGIWLGLSVPAPELAPIGTFQRGGGVAPLNCETDFGGEPLPPEDAATCKSILARHEAFVEAYDARFERMFRLDAEGIRVVGKGAALEPIAGASAAARSTPRGLVVEARLPLSALPRLSATPLETVLLAPSAAPPGNPPKLAPEAWHAASAPSPVRFEPNADIRMASFMASQGVLYPIGFSYHPSSPNLVEIVHYMRGSGGLALEAEERVLWEPAAKSGDVEVGYIAAATRLVGILKAGKFVDSDPIQGEPMGAVVKHETIHVFSFDTGHDSEVMGQYATWGVTVVNQDGSYINPIERSTDVVVWREVYEFHSDNFDRFGLRGIPESFTGEEAPRPVEITWRFDKEQQGYIPTTRRLSALPKRPGAPSVRPPRARKPERRR